MEWEEACGDHTYYQTVMLPQKLAKMNFGKAARLRQISAREEVNGLVCDSQADADMFKSSEEPNQASDRLPPTGWCWRLCTQTPAATMLIYGRDEAGRLPS